MASKCSVSLAVCVLEESCGLLPGCAYFRAFRQSLSRLKCLGSAATVTLEWLCCTLLGFWICYNTVFFFVYVLIRKSCGNKVIKNYSFSSILLKPKSNFNWKHKSRRKNWVFSNTKLVFYVSFELLKHTSHSICFSLQCSIVESQSSDLFLGSLSQVCPLEVSLFILWLSQPTAKLQGKY